jgi:hypothetical protein
MIISNLLPFGDGEHKEEATSYRCVPTDNTSESPTPRPWMQLYRLLN